MLFYILYFYNSRSLPIFLSPTMPLFFCGSLSPAPVSLFLPVLSLFLSFPLCDSLCIFLPRLFLSFSLCISLLSLSLSFSRPYLSISLEPRSLFLSLYLSLSLSPRSYLSFHLFFSLFLSNPCLSASVALSLFLSHLYPRSLSPTLVFLSFSLTPCLSFHLFSLPSLLSSSLSPTHISLSIFISPLSLLLPICGSLSPSLSHQCLIFLYPSISLSLKKEHIKLYFINIEKENL